ncbi:MAG: flagellin-like hook-associated protein FlgL [Pirellulaceae bacterium]|jgi:flagellin-like hook-associated protein FlgL
MSRIGATISGFERMLLNQLASHDNAALGNALRISSGEKINSAADSPSGIIRLTQLQRDLKVVNSTTPAIDLATSVGAQTQQNLDLVRTQLNTIRTSLLKDEGLTLSADERVAEQAIIDAAVDELDRIAGLKIEGHRILQGSTDYFANGIDAAEVRRVEVYSVSGTRISGNVSAAATQGTLTYFGPGKKISDDATITIDGPDGPQTLSVLDGDSLSSVADRVNAESHNTGVTATVDNNDLIFTTVEFGVDAVVAITVDSGDFDTTGDGLGADINVTINNSTIEKEQITGNTVSYNQNGTRFDIEFVGGFTGSFTPIEISDERAMKFRLTPEISDITEFSLKDVSSVKLGGDTGLVSDLKTGGSLSGLSTNTSNAILVIDQALAKLTIEEARADAFADVSVASSAALMDAMNTSISDAISALNDVNTEEENLLLQKNQSLAANTLYAMSILQQQQSSILLLVKQLAGMV